MSASSNQQGSAVAFAEAIAAATHDKIDLLFRNHRQPDERGITDDLFAAYHKARPSGVGLATVGDESTNGMDLELWIRFQKHWRRYAVQSKIVDRKSRAYKQLDHKVRGQRQMDLLLGYAKANRAIPMYLLYSNHTAPWSCNRPIDPKQLGICASAAHQIATLRSRHGWKSAQSVHGLTTTVPWRCLFTCPAFYGQDSRSHPFLDYDDSPNDETWTDQTIPQSIRGILYRDIREPLATLPEDYPIANRDFGPRAIMVIDIEVRRG